MSWITGATEALLATTMNAKKNDDPLRVLLLEDDAADFVAFRHALENRRMISRVSLYDDPDEALKRVVDAPDRFDIIVINHHTAGNAGLRFCHALFETRISAPRIFLTDSEALGQQLQKMRFIEDYLVKDPNREYLKVLPLLISEMMHKVAEQQARREHARAMQALEKRFRTVLSHVADGILIVGGDNTIKLANPAARRMLNGLYKNPVGQPFPYPTNPGDTTELRLDENGSEAGIVEMRVTSLEWGGQPAALASLRDMTERKRMEEALRTANQLRDRIIKELKKANETILEQQKAVIEEERLKVLLQMAGVTVQELDEPLTALLESIEQLGRKTVAPVDRERLLDGIQTTGRRISGMIQQVRMLRYEDPSLPSEPMISDVRALEQPVTILVGEGREEDFNTLRGMLLPYPRIRLLRTDTIDGGLAKAADNAVDLILSEYRYPDGTVIDFIRQLQNENLAIPVMVVTGQGDEVIASRVIQNGAYDYIPKHRLGESQLIDAIWRTLEKARIQKEVQAAQEQITRLSMVDELTGLYNRRHFDDVLSREFARSLRSGADMVLCMCDLDHFKSINDRFGHIAGDGVLSDFGQMVQNLVRQSDVGCRFGGEEFIIIFPETDLDSARPIAERLRKAVESHRFVHEGKVIDVTVSIGLAGLKTSEASSPASLVAHTDQALYVAKEEGRNRVVAFPLSIGSDAGGERLDKDRRIP